MAEHLYTEQKTTKPMIEDIITQLLHGENRQMALDFVAYLRENKMPPTWASANSWKVSFKNKGVCYIKLDQHGRSVWRVNPIIDHTKEYDEFTQRENLRNVIQQNPAYCTRCHPGTCAKACTPSAEEDSFSGVRKVYWGVEIAGICRGGDTSFVNPDAAAIECLMKLFAFRRQTIESNTVKKVKYVAQKRRISKIEVIVLDHDIKVVGLSLAKSGLPQTMESLGALWGMYTDEHRRKIKHVKLPIVNYGISLMGGARDYIVGTEVVEFEDVGGDMVTVAIPAGRYIQDTFNAYDFEQLVTETLAAREPKVKQWEEENGITAQKPAMFVEVYPVQEMVNPQGEVTNENFRQDDRLAALYPVMYTLLPIE